VLAYNEEHVEEAGFRIVLSVHDELLTETVDEPTYTAEHLAAAMTTPLPWAPGLPLAAAGFEAYRYRKE
jgi:DNA polymerase